MAIHLYYLALTLVLSLFGYYTNSVISFISYWASAAFLVISVAYLMKQPYVFKKNNKGKIPLHINILLLPYISTAYLHNAIAQYLDKTDKIQQVDAGLFVASRLDSADLNILDRRKTHVIVDMTAEFNRLDSKVSAAKIMYINIPTLAYQTADLNSLQRTLSWIDEHIKQGHNVIVQCDLGIKSSVFVATAYLLIKYPQLTVAGALQKIQAIRPKASMDASHLEQLVEYRRIDALDANPSPTFVMRKAIRQNKWERQHSH